MATLAAVALIGAVVPPQALAVAAGVALIAAWSWLLLRRGHRSHGVGMRVEAASWRRGRFSWPVVTAPG